MSRILHLHSLRSYVFIAYLLVIFEEFIHYGNQSHHICLGYYSVDGLYRQQKCQKLHMRIQHNLMQYAKFYYLLLWLLPY